MQAEFDSSHRDFLNNPRVVMGLGQAARLPELICDIDPAMSTCDRVLLVRGGQSLQQTPQWRRLLYDLHRRGIQLYEQEVRCEPSVELIDGATADYRNENIQVVVGIGGGSVMDAAKAIAAMLTVPGSVEDYLEGVGSRQHPGTSLPVVAVPTTAGTGSEATKNAVISRFGRNGFKKSLRHDNFIPRIAVLDGELSLGCPSQLTASCGLDALTQLIEAYTSSKAHPLTDSLAVSGLEQIAWALPLCVGSEPDDPAARQALLYAAYLSGVCLANVGLGVVHGLAGVIGGRFDIAHGTVCGALLTAATRRNIETAQAHLAASAVALQKYRRVGALLGGECSGDDCLQQLLLRLSEWTTDWGVSGLSRYGVCEQDISGILEGSGLKNNPVRLSKTGMAEIVRSSL